MEAARAALLIRTVVRFVAKHFSGANVHEMRLRFGLHKFEHVIAQLAALPPRSLHVAG